jgi:diguanylate cyclase (GGDEF)-like protein
MIDIDDFKTINTCSAMSPATRSSGNVAQILRRSVRAFDVCARFGGEEFAILMPATSVASATKVAAFASASSLTAPSSPGSAPFA